MGLGGGAGVVAGGAGGWVVGGAGGSVVCLTDGLADGLTDGLTDGGMVVGDADGLAECAVAVGLGAEEWAATAVLQPARGQVGILHLEGGWIENTLPGAEFDLGLGYGRRAFRNHAFTGDRMIFGTAEYRLTIANDFLGLIGLGLAGFVDHGGAWYAGSPRRVGWDAGIGIRLGASRSTETEALRFDLARRFANDAQGAGWVFTVGKGFVFSPLGRRAL